jgi:hypothetical protein
LLINRFPFLEESWNLYSAYLPPLLKNLLCILQYIQRSTLA